MSKEKYLAKIDKILVDVLNKKSKSLAEKNELLFSDELVKNGSVKKIAFDVYKVENDPYDSLWTLEDVVGQQYLVRANDPKYDVSESGNWSLATSYDKSNITLAYKSVPIARFSSSDYGFNPDEVTTFKSALLERIHGDNIFIKEVLDEQPESKKIALISTFPEFKKFLQG